MADTLADRIMEHARFYAIDAMNYGLKDPRTHEARDELAALVAEATAERVCRWLEIGDRDWGVDCGGVVVDPPLHQWRFCPWCGGLIELVTDGQEVTDG